VKTLALIARKPGLAREEFRAHYEQVHAPLGLTVMRGLVRYVRHHVREELYGAAGFDAATSFAYRDAAALEGVIARLASPAGDAVRRDELTFMDKPRNRFFAVREAAETGARDRSAALQCIALVKRAAEQGADDFAAAFASRALSALGDATRGLRWCLQHEALATFGEPPYDAAVQLHADADAGLAAWCAAREREGARAVLVRVSEHETPLPPGGVG
jgi:EthD domain